MLILSKVSNCLIIDCEGSFSHQQELNNLEWNHFTAANLQVQLAA